MNQFISFGLHWVFFAVLGLYLVEASRGYFLWWCTGSSLQCFLLLRSSDSTHESFSSYSMEAQYLWLRGPRA